MQTASQLRIRRSLTDLQNDYLKGNKKPLEDLMRAWKGMKERPAEHPQSFFTLGGYHGEPFRGAGWGNASYWGGYCNHGNVLFPTWHRVYLMKIEEALQSVPGCADVMLPFWDETGDESLAHGVPWALTNEAFMLDGVPIPNPLISFTLNRSIKDNLAAIPDADYSKPAGYQTVRYPLSGLVGNDKDKAATAEHNAMFPDYEENVKLLNANIVDWLTSGISIGGKYIPTNVHAKFTACLEAPNYTVFSNTTSQTEWNDHIDGATAAVVALESPHNSMHLAVGGYDLPGSKRSPIYGANGDMGEADTSGLDPIFYFHHCFIDRVFWLWQTRHNATDRLEVIAGYPGTNSVDNQGPTPGIAPNSWLTLETPLNPFMKTENGVERPFQSTDCINIEKQLGYTYGPGSLAEREPGMSVLTNRSTKVVRVSGINRANVRGSFMISAFARVDGERVHIGTEAVFSRWNVQGCANCQTHLETKAFIALHGVEEESARGPLVEIEIRNRDGLVDKAASLQANANSKVRVALV